MIIRFRRSVKLVSKNGRCKLSLFRLLSEIDRPRPLRRTPSKCHKRVASIPDRETKERDRRKSSQPSIKPWSRRGPTATPVSVASGILLTETISLECSIGMYLCRRRNSWSLFQLAAAMFGQTTSIGRPWIKKMSNFVDEIRQSPLPHRDQS